MASEGDWAALPLEQALRRHFGFVSFRDGQREVIESVLEGIPTLGIMPTGTGKSLCYQLPALLLPGLTLVVSPLVSLMKDQVDQLRARRIRAAYVNSSLTEGQRQAALFRAVRGELQLLYVAPERFRTTRFLEAMERLPIELLAIDEAHCISQWGHDFRPDYARLGELRRRFRPPRTVALTATATPEVRADIARLLALEKPRVFVAGFDRKNLSLEVRRVRDHKEKLEVLSGLARTGESGIVYTATRPKADRLTLELRLKQIRAVTYHAGLLPDDRANAQEEFMRGRAQVVVATNAFGMGIDKPDIRFVVHAQIPKAVEAYYQEVGRAGRDGAPARALLLFQPADVGIQERLIASGYPPPMLVRDLWEHIRFEPLVRTPVGTLAERLGAEELKVQAAIKLLESAGHLERGARGDGPAEVAVLDRLSPRQGPLGFLLDVLRDRIPDDLPQSLLLEELVGQTGLDLRSLRFTLARLDREGLIRYRPPWSGRGIAIRDMGLAASALRVDFEAVRERERLSKQLLQRMVGYAQTSGCRRAYLLRYFGEAAPARCSHCDRCTPSANAMNAMSPSSSSSSIARANTTSTFDAESESSFETSYALVQGGCSLAEVAKLRGISEAQAAQHLVQSLRAGRPLDLDRLVSPSVQARILAAQRLQPGASPSELQRFLEGVSAIELKLTLVAHLEAAQAVIRPARS